LNGYDFTLNKYGFQGIARVRKKHGGIGQAKLAQYPHVFPSFPAIPNDLYSSHYHSHFQRTRFDWPCLPGGDGIKRLFRSYEDEVQGLLRYPPT
jgi:hypothetical protein